MQKMKNDRHSKEETKAQRQNAKNDDMKYSLLKGPDVYKIMRENYWKFG